MPTFTELNQNTSMRKRIPLQEAFIEAYPEETPALSLIDKTRGKTTSPTSSEIEWPFKTFRAPRNNPIYDGEDITDAEAEDNEANKTMLKGRIQLIRSVVMTGRIAEATMQQHGNVPSIHKDHIKDALRGMRVDKNFIILSDADSQEQAAAAGGNPKKPYQTRGLASWRKRGAPSHIDLPVPAMAQTPAGSIVSLTDPVGGATAESTYTEDMLKAQLKSCWDARRTKGKWKMLCNSNLQDVMDNWLCFGPVTAATMPIRRMDGKLSDNKFGASIRSYEGSFGNVEMMPTHDLPAGVFAHLLDFDFLKLLYVDEVGWKELENKGGGPRGYADSLFALADLNPQAHGLVKLAA